MKEQDVKQHQIVTFLNGLLEPENFPDYCPNGLQVEGDGRIVKRLAFAVSLTEEVIDEAMQWGADFLLCHHGVIWDKQSHVVVGPYRRKLHKLLASGIAMAAYHLPLDFNPSVGNNIQLAKLIGLEDPKGIMLENGNHKAFMGTWKAGMPKLKETVQALMNREPLVLDFDRSGHKEIKVAICSGGAQSYFQEAIAAGANCYITGEASEQNYTEAQEFGVSFIAAGHYRTEQFGLIAVAELLTKKFGIKTEFLATENPI